MTRPIEVLSRWQDGARARKPEELERDFVSHVLASRRLTAARVVDTCLVGAPVAAPGGEFAAICAAFGPRANLEDEDATTVVDFFAHLTSFCLHHPGALDELLESVRLDGLTGCLNYSAVLRELTREITRSERHELQLSCCFVDLDGFGEVNERHGHLRANRVLANVAAILAAAVRSTDSLGRFGGDEFVILLPETDAAAARAFADRLRKRLRKSRLGEDGGTVDASVGVAEWRRGWAAEDLLEAADRAMLHAKRAGGGRVV